MDNKKKDERAVKALINKYERPHQNHESFDKKKEMYLRQTDRNYKDGDRN